MNLKEATPAEIDTQLAEIYGRLAQARARVAAQATRLTDARKQAERGDTFTGSPARITQLEEVLAEATQTANLIEAETIPFQVEYHRRGGWTRAFLVQNNGGHVHNTMHCATCFPTTSFGWLTQVSDHTEAEIVELAGEGACSVCYPTAPRIGRNRLELPATIAAREERAAAKAERDAKKAAKAIGPIKIMVGGYVEKITTIAAAWQFVVGDIANARAYGYSAHVDARHTVAAALIERLEVTSDEFWADVERKVAARIKREAAGR